MPMSFSDFERGVIGKIGGRLEVRQRLGKHRRYEIWYQGLKVAETYCSHGRRGKDIVDPVLAKMKRQLRLDTLGQLYDLRDCPLTADGYVALLSAKGVIPT